jgi:hypothetical protein
MLCRILHCKDFGRDRQVDVLDAEGRKPSWNLQIRKVAVDLSRCRRPEAGRPIGANTSIVPAPKFVAKRKTPSVGAENQTFADRACRVVDGEDRLIRRGTARPLQ